MIKKITVILLILAIAFSLCACGQNAQSAPKVTENSNVSGSEEISPATAGPADSEEPSAAPDESAKESEVSIEITPPEGWSSVEGSVLSVQYMKNTASFMVKEEYYTGSTLDEVVSEALTMFEGAFSNIAVVGDAEDAVVDGKEAKKLTFTCTVSGLSMKYLYVFLFAGGRTYAITFGDLADTFDTLSTDYETILNDIRFVVK